MESLAGPERADRSSAVLETAALPLSYGPVAGEPSTGAPLGCLCFRPSDSAAGRCPVVTHRTARHTLSR